MGDLVRLDSAGIARVLKGAEMAALVGSAANEIAQNVRDQGIRVDDDDVPLPVEVSSYTTDRAAASVAIAHPSGVAVQAKHGALSKAASAAGVSIRSR